MKKVYEVRLNNERVFISKGKFGWKVIYPTNSLLKENNLEQLDKKTSIKHFWAGRSWWNLLVITILVIIVLGSAYEYSNAVNIANECLNKLNQVTILP